MEKQTTIKTIFHFFLVKIILGIVIIAGLVFLVEWSGNLLLDKTPFSGDSKNLIMAVADSVIALTGYIFVFRAYENRRITELSLPAFGKNAIMGTTTGLILQSLFILVIFLAGGYSITRVNPVSSLIPAFTAALEAGFVAEILIVGVFFRIAEERFGTIITLVFMTVLFAILHINSPGATVLSVCATAVAAGFMLSAAYVAQRSLWLPIFLHLGWDLAEPGIFGAFNSSLSIKQSLFTSQIGGPTLLTGGITGPQNSLQALILCSITGILLLCLAKRNNNFIRPFWER